MPNLVRDNKYYVTFTQDEKNEISKLIEEELDKAKLTIGLATRAVIVDRVIEYIESQPFSAMEDK